MDVSDHLANIKALFGWLGAVTPILVLSLLQFASLIGSVQPSEGVHQVSEALVIAFGPSCLLVNESILADQVGSIACSTGLRSRPASVGASMWVVHHVKGTSDAGH